MSKAVGICALICFGAVVIIVAIVQPSVLSDKNEFLKGFVNHEFLNVIGVILAITLASAANLHLEFNKIEERFRKKGGLSGTRAEVRSAARALIYLFAAGVAVVVAKPLLSPTDSAQCLWNGSALFILLWY